jgi:hypothetical protein
MSWDPSLLRKFSSTGHFRLLNQLRGDLKKRPLNRDVTTGALKMPGASGRSDRQRRPLLPQSRSTTTTPVTTSAQEKESNTTFRERLNAIDMR